jgi:protein-glutamine gamma-glutamyltransferase
MQAISPRPRAEQLFLLSSYIALTMACICLVWSEIGILNEIVIYAALAGALIVASYVMEGRWSLSARNANRIGVAIGLFAGLSVARQIVHPPSEGPMTQMPFPTSMIPLLGPLLLLLLSVKLLRPKTVADHWWLQVIGLVCVSLGCTLAEDGVFAILMAIYLVLSLWCLALFFLYRERLTHPDSRITDLPKWRQIATWSVPILLLGGAGFLTLPRSSAVWHVSQNFSRLETGIPEDPGLDLHKTGELTLTMEVAFEVHAEDQFRHPKVDLPADQRWRGPVYRDYKDGNWRPSPPGPGEFGAGAEKASGLFPWFVRTDKYYLNYALKEKIGPTPFVSDPVFFINDQVPVVTVNSDGSFGRWIALSDSMLQPVPKSFPPEEGKYRQVTVPPESPGVREAHLPFDRSLVIESPALPRLPEWTNDLLADLVKKNKIPANALSDRNLDGQILADNYEVIARGLTDYLSNSGEYGYSLTLETKDTTIDPTLDFLFNVKTGHCNRFASALALMLRQLQIPSQVVTGYRGADSLGDGNYAVRNCYAHTWVEIAVPRRTPAPSPVFSAGPEKWYWITLDPTPMDAETSAASANHWWETGLSFRKIYRNLIINFSYGNRDDVFRDILAVARSFSGAVRHEVVGGTTAGMGFVLFFAGLALGATLVLARLVRMIIRRWRMWRGAARFSTQTEFYRRMLGILSRRGWKRAPFQTSREFADAISHRLQSRKYDDSLADVVRRTASLFDRVRFGNTPLDAEEAKDVRSGLDRLARALAKR